METSHQGIVVPEITRTHNIYIHIQGKQPAARLELEHLGGRAKASDLSLSDVSLSCSDKVASLSRFFSASRQSITGISRGYRQQKLDDTGSITESSSILFPYLEMIFGDDMAK